MFFSYSSSSITLIDIVLLEQRRRNRGSRVRGEKGGGGAGSRAGGGVEGRGGGWGEQEEGAVDRKQWLWWHRLEGQHSQKQRAGADGPSSPQEGHGAQDAACRCHPPWHGQDTAWASLPQRCFGKAHPFPKPCGTEQPLRAGTPCRAQALGSRAPGRMMLRLGHGRGSVSPGSADP